jgi:ankyrin repeat protein
VGATPLLLAVVGGHLSAAKYLAAAEATVDATDLKGYTALMVRKRK